MPIGISLETRASASRARGCRFALHSSVQHHAESGAPLVTLGAIKPGCGREVDGGGCVAVASR